MLLTDYKYRRTLIYIGYSDFAPLANGGSTDILVVRGYIASDAEFGLHSTRGDNLLGQLCVAIGRLDKELRLMFARSSALQSLYGTSALRLLHRNIAVECE